MLRSVASGAPARPAPPGRPRTLGAAPARVEGGRRLGAATHGGLTLVAAVILAGLAPGAARAQVAGSVHGHFVAAPQGDYGGALTGEIAYPLDVFRFGGYFGVVAVPSEVDVRNRIFMPLALSVGVDLVDEAIGVALRARGGLWGGATQEAKLTAGGLLGGGAYLLFVLGDGVSLSVGLDLWGLFGEGETALFLPGAGLTWRPPSPDPAPLDAAAGVDAPDGAPEAP